MCANPKVGKIVKRLLAVLAALGLVLHPGLGYGQESGQASEDMSELLETTEVLSEADFNPQIVFNSQDREDWSNLTNKDLFLYDRRIMTQLLNYLVSSEGGNFDPLVIDRIRRGYEMSENRESRKVEGAENISQHHFGKAASLAAVGTTSCYRDVLFPRFLDEPKPVFVHWQVADDDPAKQRWPFARNFDALARQFFWLEARALTNRPITSLTWSNFKQQIAKAEIEERFALTPGELAYVPVSSLAATLARQRLSASLGLPTIPEADTEAAFYESIGRRLFEQELNLPLGSFEGRSWPELYQQLGLRVLQQQASLPPSPGVDQSLLEGRLEAREGYYNDPHVAFNLPTAEYLPPTDQSDLFTRIKNGDPTAFALVGAYALAESLELAPTDTKRLLYDLSAEAERTIDLRSARPIDEVFQPEAIFAPSANNHPTLFEAIGRTRQAELSRRLAWLNEGLLSAISETNKTPSLADLLGVLTDPEKRQKALASLSQTSQEDANYDGGFTIEALSSRGTQLLAKALDLTPKELAQFEAQPNNPELVGVGETVDLSFGWPLGTAQDLVARQSQPPSPETAKLQERHLLQIGAAKLWQRLKLPLPLFISLQAYYFQGPPPDPSELDQLIEEETLPESETTPPVKPEEEGEAKQGTTEVTAEGEGEEPEPEEGEEISFVVGAEDDSLAERLSQATGLPVTDSYFFLTGQMAPALIRATLARLGFELQAMAPTLPSPDVFVSLFDQPTSQRAQDITKSDSLPLVSPNLLPELKQAIENNHDYQLWRTVHGEAIDQWNVTCFGRQAAAEAAINQLIDKLVSLPAEPAADNQPARPLQLLIFDKERLSPELREKITAAYPGADGENSKWGLYSAPRTWNEVYVAY